MPDLLAAALNYAARGWPVFMLGRSKRPVANCPACAAADRGHDPATCGHLTCHGFYAASTDPNRVAAIVAAVPCGQLALRTGATSGVVVIDVDPGHGGAATLTRLIAAALPRPRHGCRPGRVACTCTTGTPASRCRAARANAVRDSAQGST